MFSINLAWLVRCFKLVAQPFKIIFICVEGDIKVNRAKSEIEVDVVLGEMVDEGTEVGEGAEREGV